MTEAQPGPGGTELVALLAISGLAVPAELLPGVLEAMAAVAAAAHRLALPLPASREPANGFYRPSNL